MCLCSAWSALSVWKRPSRSYSSVEIKGRSSSGRPACMAMRHVATQCKTLSFPTATTAKTTEKASECVLNRMRASPAAQITQPRSRWGLGVGGRASTRSPCGPILKSMSPSGSGAEAKYCMLRCAPSHRVKPPPTTAATAAIHPMGRSKNGSRRFIHVYQSRGLVGKAQPMSTSRAAGTKATRQVTSVVTRRPRGTAPDWLWTKPCMEEITNQATPAAITTRKPMLPMRACSSRLPRSDRQPQAPQSPRASRRATEGSQ
mmetsp:Transcript_119225/g.338027  ORF Transcript_119225/g.338027 Transcript_119225/m.338027 type:complete len:259 (-) Transcript_119225:506-1282(-)